MDESPEEIAAWKKHRERQRQLAGHNPSKDSHPQPKPPPLDVNQQYEADLIERVRAQHPQLTEEPDAREFLPDNRYGKIRAVAEAFSSVTRNAPADLEWPTIPVFGRARLPFDTAIFKPKPAVDQVGDDAFFWGRVPLNQLIRSFEDTCEKPADEQYIDYAPPLRVSGSGSTYDKLCEDLLSKTSASVNTAKIGVGIIDCGDDSNTGPDDYNGKLRHAVTGNVKLSDHAERVLSILLERLDANTSILSDVTVSCALVKPPSAMVISGLGAFDQASAAEMLDAVKAMRAHLDSDGLPAVVNMSLGTHVGPHNGESPLEQYISGRLCIKQKRFLISAAGNEGGKGLAAKRVLKAAERDFLTVRTGARCKELLIEIWWDSSIAATLDIQADVYDLPNAGASTLLGILKSGPWLTGSTLTRASAGFPRAMTGYSMFSAKCHGSYSCAALAICTLKTALPLLEIDISLESSADVVANAWIVVCEDDPKTNFLEGGPDGTLVVPASDPAVVGVAGIDSTGHIWKGSSRGPSAQYRTGVSGTESPLVAHLADLSGEYGTSYASPRVCGDAAKTILSASTLGSCSNALELVRHTYKRGGTLPKWDERFGYHKQLT
jgi:hypothetical protein